MEIGRNLAYHVIRHRHGTGLERGRLLTRGIMIEQAGNKENGGCTPAPPRRLGEAFGAEAMIGAFRWV